MSATMLEHPARIASGGPLWRAAVTSFLPVRVRPRADRLLCYLPLGMILALQSVMSLRLSNSAFQDEALYVHTGRLLLNYWTGGDPVYAHPEKFFSGAPQIYPVWAGLLDQIGGLGLVRLFSTLCMLSATIAVFWTSKVLLTGRVTMPDRAAGLAALVFALSPSVIFLGNFATFDAPSFAMIAWATAVAAWSTVRKRALAWSVVIGTLCALSVLTKYSCAIDVPFVLALIPLAGWRGGRGDCLLRGGLAGLTCVALLGGSVLTWAAPLLTGLRATTTGRAAFDRQTPVELVGHVVQWDGVPLALILIGAVLLARRAPAVAILLGLGGVAAAAYQIHMGEYVSLHKHVVLGLVIGAPLAGVTLARLSRIPSGAPVTALVLWVAFLVAVPQSDQMFATWPDSTILQRQLAYSIKAMPWIRMVGDAPEPMQYGLQDRTRQWQWTSTYENSFFYKGLSGIAAYRQALRDNFFQLAFLDGAYPISAQLLPEMASYGFRETSMVRTLYTGHAWHIYQRFDHLTP